MKSIKQILEALPSRYQDLHSQKPMDIHKLTPSAVRKELEPVNGQYPGIYLFSTIRDNTPAYVGRSAKLDVRVGTDHRSIDSIAQLTGKLMRKHRLPNMVDARKKLYKEYRVRMLVVEDVGMRAMLEIYIAIMLGTEFNVI